MTTFQAIAAAIAAIVLFLYGLQGFGRELQAVGGEALRVWLGRVTASRWRGFLVGAATTAVVQSSSATTALAVTLVDASVITFGASLGILLGANVGTTATAWLVSFKLTGIGPVCIILGALLSAVPVRLGVLGKAVFYFGLIFFALDLIGEELQPLQEHPVMRQGLALAAEPLLGVVAGIVLTALIQSSSVTTGLAIVLVQQGLLPPEAAIPVVLGANVGSTSTALVASLGMSPGARASAVANLLFNATGLLLYLPFIGAFSRFVVASFPGPGLAVAWAHLIFNLSIALLFLATLGVLEPRLRRWLLPGGNPARDARQP